MEGLSNKNIVCKLHNNRNGHVEIYRGAVYTKLDGVYGYICVEGFRVLFFWCNEYHVSMDELDFFTVSYENKTK